MTEKTEVDFRIVAVTIGLLFLAHNNNDPIYNTVMWLVPLYIIYLVKNGVGKNTHDTGRVFMYIGLIMLSIVTIGRYSYEFYILALAAICFYTGWKNVTESFDSVHVLLAVFNLILTYATTFAVASSKVWWFESFYVKSLFVLSVGSLAWPMINLAAVLIIASILYGDLETYSQKLKTKKLENHKDPYGDDHAQEILENK